MSKAVTLRSTAPLSEDCVHGHEGCHLFGAVATADPEHPPPMSKSWPIRQRTESTPWVTVPAIDGALVMVASKMAATRTTAPAYSAVVCPPSRCRRRTTWPQCAPTGVAARVRGPLGRAQRTRPLFRRRRFLLPLLILDRQLASNLYAPRGQA